VGCEDSHHEVVRSSDHGVVGQQAGCIAVDRSLVGATGTTGFRETVCDGSVEGSGIVALSLAEEDH
jgi:hypothetical protein